MTDKEILSQLKKSYEYLTDIRENGCMDHCSGQLDNNLIEKLQIAKSNIEDIYYDFYQTLDKEDLRVPAIEGKKYVNDKAYICRSIDGDYEIGEEQICMICEDLDYYWYDDQEFLLSENNWEVSI